MAPYTFTWNETKVDITSPNYPKSGLLKLKCSYSIKAPSNKVLQLEFLEFEFKGNNYIMEVYDGNDTDSKLIFKEKPHFLMRKNKIPSPIFSAGNEILIRLVSDSHSPSSYDPWSRVLYRIQVDAKGVVEYDLFL